MKQQRQLFKLILALLILHTSIALAQYDDSEGGWSEDGMDTPSEMSTSEMPMEGGEEIPPAPPIYDEGDGSPIMAD